MSNVLLQPDTEGTCCDCRPDPCDPCTPPCPEVTLLCDSISASKTKCGFAEFVASTPPKFYRTYHRSQVGSYTGTKQFFDVSGDTCSALTFTETRTQNLSEEYERHYNDSCVLETIMDSKSSSSSHTGVSPCSSATSFSCWTSLGTVYLFCSFEHTHTGPSTTSSSTVQTTTESVSNSYGPTIAYSCEGCSQSGSLVSTETLSEEYTTDELIENTIAALPAYFGHLGCEENITIGFRTDGQNCVCFASRSLSSDETSYSINRFKYAFTFAAQAVAFTLHWVERFTPEGGGAVVDTPRSELIAIGVTESSTYTVNEPGTDGTISVPTDEVYCS